MSNVVSRWQRTSGRAAAAWLFAGASLAVALVAAAGCSNKGVYGSPSGGSGASGASGPGPGSGGGGAAEGNKGVGEACQSTSECRDGLACEGDVCVPGHSLSEGEPCTISGECKVGLYCAGGVCAAAGAGENGDACTSDADCASGYRCALVGLSLQCVPEGTVDAGGACATSADCFGGLACVGGACAQPEKGSTTLGPKWDGVDCPEESGPVQAYFRIPRGTDDGDFYRLPFPNDVLLENGVLDLKGHPTPGKDLLGYDLLDRYLRAIEAENDGWGLHHWTYFRFSGGLDFDILKDAGAVYLVNLTTGAPMGPNWYLSSGGGNYICPNWLGVRAATGTVFTPGSTYAAYVTNGAKAKGGAPVSPSPDLEAMLASTAPSEPALAAQWPKYAVLRDYLAAKAIDPATIVNATVFTVGHPRAPVEKLQPIVDAAGAPAVSSWVKCDAGVTSPCPDFTGERACVAADPDFDELHALVSLPIYQSGTAPYLTPEDGGGIELDDTGAPVVVRKEDVCLSLTVPKGAPPAGGWPTVVFAHGTGGHFRTHVVRGISKDLALGADDGSGGVVKAAVLGIDQVGHGPRRGGSLQSPQHLVWNFANPRAVKGNLQQGAADLMALAHLAKSIAFDQASSPTGDAFALSGQVALWAHSQGAVQAAIALPFATYAGAVLSGERASFIDTLLDTTTPVSFAAGTPIALADASGSGALIGGDANPALSLIQTYLDGADALSYARLIAKGPPMGATPRPLFQVYGVGDTTAPPSTQEIFALGASLGLCAHDPSVTTPDAIGKLTEIPTPASGNLSVAGQPITAVLRQYAPDAGKDAHLVAFDVASARADAERFLAGALAGNVPVVGE